jgi:tellurium resistance protein TerD
MYMGISLTKGQSVSLTKAAADAGSTAPLTKVVAGAGWDGTNDAPIDLDLMAVLIGDDGKALPDANGNGSNADEALLFFNNKELPGLHHTGDNLTGEGEGDDEQIVITLADVAANVKEIAIVVASYSGETFDKVANAQVRMVNEADQKELTKYELSTGAEFAGKHGVELGRLVRNGAEWEFKATGATVEGNNFNEVVKALGINN